MHCMQNGISLQFPMVRMHVMVLVGQLNKLLLIQPSSNLPGQILSPKSLVKFSNIWSTCIQLFWVPTTEIIENKHLEERLEKSSTLPGSKSKNLFRPSTDSREFLVLLVSGEEAVLVKISNSLIHDLKIGDYVACTYEFDCYSGILYSFPTYAVNHNTKEGFCFLNQGIKTQFFLAVKVKNDFSLMHILFLLKQLYWCCLDIRLFSLILLGVSF